MSASTYLDYNASAPLLPAARDAMVAALDVVGNPSSVHRFGRDARRLVEHARRHLAVRLAVDPQRVVFTSGATEANAAALSGVAVTRRLVSAIEHDSVLATDAVETFAVDGEGVADPAGLERALAEADAPTLVSMQLVNNETGVVQPVQEAAALAHDHGALIHCDAVQALGRLAVSPDALGVDLLTVSSHKIGGPKGAGALIVRDGLPLKPLLRGGGQERRRRAGTENVAAIAGFGAAVEAANVDAWSRATSLRNRLETQLVATDAGAMVFGAHAGRVGNTTCVAMPGVDAETQVMAFDLAGIAVSAGSACSSGKVASSHVLAAMGIPDALARCAIRVSLCPDTKAGDIDRFVAVWGQIAARGHQGRRAVA
ncbi:MAG: cysteine desulfurase family protein [Pseudomonadota bacterium]